jgi:hypothetical protein
LPQIKDGIILCGFSKPGTAPPNRRIVDIGVEHALRLGTPIYAQLDTYVPEELGLDVTYTDTWADYYEKPTTTLRMARGAVAWAKERGINRLLIVGAKPHLWRCIRDQQMAIKEAGAAITVVSPFTDEIHDTKYSSWFFEGSEQPWCRSVWHWLRRETFLYFMPFFIYKMVAS